MPSLRERIKILERKCCCKANITFDEINLTNDFPLNPKEGDIYINTTTGTYIYTGTTNDWVLSSAQNSSQEVAFSTTVPFDNLYSYAPIEFINSNIIFTPNLVGSIPGAVTVYRVLADGVSTVTFSSITEVNGSQGYDNTLNIVNYFAFFFDGYSYFVNIYQDLNAVPVDLVPPVIQSAEVPNVLRNRIILTYNDTLSLASPPIASNFTVSGGKTITAVTISGMEVWIDVNTVYAFGNVITVSYTASGTSIKDVPLNNAANLVNYSVTNNIAAPDIVAPVLLTATVENANLNKIVLTYDEDLSLLVIPAVGDYAGSGGRAVTNVAIALGVVTLTVNTPYAYGDVITISYTAGVNKLQDPSGNFAANLVAQSVTNNINSPATIVAWGNLVTTTDSGGYLNYGGSLPSGGRGTVAIDTTVPFEVYAEFTSLCPATVLFLDKDAANGYVWGGGQVFEAGTYHVSGLHYWAVDGGTANSLGAFTPPKWVKLRKSGANDIILSTCATEFGSYVDAHTYSGVITTSTLYIHVLFAANTAGDKIQVKYVN